MGIIKKASIFKSQRTKLNLEKRLIQFCIMWTLFGLYALIQHVTGEWGSVSPSSPDTDFSSFHPSSLSSNNNPAQRSLLQYADTDSIKIGNFPADYFDYADLRGGAVLLHITCSLVMFLGLSIVSDEYFEPALTVLAGKLKLSEDVAGATIFSLGGSAPELFVMFFSVFVSKSDIGLGTVFGSAGINQLGLLALIALFCEPTDLTPYPIARDCFYYCLGVFTLLIVLSRSDPSRPEASAVVHWYMSLGLLGGYLLYLAIMYFNEGIQKFIHKRIDVCKPYGGPNWGFSRFLRTYVLDGVGGIIWDLIIYSVIILNIVIVLINVSTGGEDDVRHDLDIFCKVVFGFEMLVKLIALDPVCYWTDPFNAFDGFLVYLIIVELVLSNSIAAGVRAVRLFRLFRGLRGLRGARMFKTCFGIEDDASKEFEVEYEFDVKGVQKLDEEGNKIPKRTRDGKVVFVLDEQGQRKKKDPDWEHNAYVALLEKVAKQVAKDKEERAQALHLPGVSRTTSFQREQQKKEVEMVALSIHDSTGSIKAPKRLPSIIKTSGRTQVGDASALAPAVIASVSRRPPADESEPEEASDYSPFTLPQSLGGKFFWIIGFPLAVGMHFTIPNPRVQRFKEGYWFLLTILMCLVWIGALTYLLLWVTLTIGVALSIRDNVMGLVWMALGTSIPDVLQSVSAAKQGQGDGAVAGALGSNVFNIVMAIPFAWLWYGICFPNSTVVILSQNLVMSLMVILICMALSMLCIHFGGWRLTPLVGAACALLYAIFIVFVVLLESNAI